MVDQDVFPRNGFISRPVHDHGNILYQPHYGGGGIDKGIQSGGLKGERRRG